ncbi:MAG: hypothetical protein GY940_43090, partial [bacterium]|nr:hypothetical protein [bacterium]
MTRLAVIFPVLFFILLFPTALPGNGGMTVEEGYKFIRGYAPEEYNGHPQNWCVTQDNQGIIYVANQGDLLAFDGVNWRRIAVPNQTARTVTIDDSGTVYVGGVNQLGFLEPDANGALRYVSLTKYLDKDKRNFST